MATIGRRSFLAATAGTAVALTGKSVVEAQQAGQIDVSSLGKTPHTKFACNLEMWWTGLPFVERIKKAAEFGYPAVEFWNWRNKDLEAVARTARELGIVITQFTAAFGFAHPDRIEKFVDDIKEACRVAKVLGAKMACVVPGKMLPGFTEQQMHDLCIKALKKVAPICEDNDLTLIVEPLNIRVDHPGQCLYRSSDAVRICREVGSTHVKINWDFYHLQISEGDLCGHLREGFDQLGYAQLADHPGRNQPGTGEIRYNRVLQELYNLGYRGYVGLELRPKGGELAAALAVKEADVW